MMNQHDDGTVTKTAEPAMYAGIITVGAILALFAIRLLMEHK
jgi:hypothetical protein